MADKITIVAQVAMDSFYQDFKGRKQFLGLKHFTFLCIAADGKLKQDEYNNQVQISLKQGTMNDLSMAADNYETVEVSVKDNVAKLPASIMSFSGDKGTIAVNEVSANGKCKNFMRLNPDEKWQVEKIKDVIFWYPECDAIKFINLKNLCNPEKIKVTYIPQLNKNSAVQETRKWAILNMVLQYFKAAKEGVVISMSNDGNENNTMQTEINKALFRMLRS